MSVISTYKTYLMLGTGTTSVTYSKLCDIKSFPDLGGEPERIDVTSLSDAQRVYIPGVQDINSMTFTANYDETAYETINALTGQTNKLSVWFGATGTAGNETPDGSDGKFDWTGDIMAYVTGGDVNAAVEMTIVCTPLTPVVKQTT